MPKLGADTYVPKETYQALLMACGEDFTESYLWGARQIRDTLHIRTLCGWNAIQNTRTAKDALRAIGLDLPKPTPFPGDGDRPVAEEHFTIQRKKRRSHDD